LLARKVLTTLLSLGLLVGVVAIDTTAQGGSTEPQAQVGNAFTYQGELRDGSGPIDGVCDLRFKLWDRASEGTQAGSTVTLTQVPLSAGRFTAELDFGASVFGGDARWLEVGVCCPAGTGSYTWLAPRQALTASPYALYALKAPWSGLGGVPPGLSDGDDDTTYTAGTGLALSGDEFSLRAAYSLPQGCASGQIAEWGGSAWTCGDDDAGGSGAHDHWNETWTGSGTGLTLSSNDIGIVGHHDSTTGSEPGVKGVTDSLSSFSTGVLGKATHTSPALTTSGVWGSNAGTGGWSIGVGGVVDGPGKGVYGSATTGSGVYGEANVGTGVYGTAGDGKGVFGLSEHGIGVVGQTGSDSSTQPGVWGVTYSTSSGAIGVRGTVSIQHPGGSSAGVLGVNYGIQGLGVGVWGEQKGSGWGVYGKTQSGYAGYFSGDIRVTGSCTGCVLTYLGVNDGSVSLEPGDLVAVSGISEPLAGGSTPMLRVRRAGTSNGEALVGVVQSRGQVVGTQGTPGEEIENLVRGEGPAAHGDYLFITVQGLTQVKVSANAGDIQPGYTLTLASSPDGHASLAPLGGNGPQIGRAMESLDGASGLIWVMVDLQ
jgi:hypothetical protein